eukprot:scaffold7335_cov417-Prasinococcus_capsulatus_cf.AAC.17
MGVGFESLSKNFGGWLLKEKSFDSSIPLTTSPEALRRLRIARGPWCVRDPPVVCWCASTPFCPTVRCAASASRRRVALSRRCVSASRTCCRERGRSASGGKSAPQ